MADSDRLRQWRKPGGGAEAGREARRQPGSTAGQAGMVLAGGVEARVTGTRVVGRWPEPLAPGWF